MQMDKIIKTPAGQIPSAGYTRIMAWGSTMPATACEICVKINSRFDCTLELMRAILDAAQAADARVESVGVDIDRHAIRLTNYSYSVNDHNGDSVIDHRFAVFSGPAMAN